MDDHPFDAEEVLFDQFSFELFPPSGKQSVVIARDKEEGFLDISVNDLTLSYDESRFRTEPGVYVGEQLDVHEALRQLAGKDLSQYHEDWNERIKLYMDLERVVRWTSIDVNKAINLAVQLAKPFLVAGCWIQRTTLQNMMKEVLETERSDASGYRVMREAIKEGRNFVEAMRGDSRQLPGEVRDGLGEWASIQADLRDKYSRLHEAAFRQYQGRREFCQRFYPKI